MRKKVLTLIVILIISSMASITVGAYNLKPQSYTKSKVQNLKWYVDDTVYKKNYGGYATTGALGWNSSNYVQVTGSVSREASAELRFYASNTDKGSIVATNYNAHNITGDTIKYSKIYTWAGFKNISTNNKHETMVHEVGHSLGLNHENDNYSIMLATGFIERTIPTADDFNGIKAKYR